MENFEKELLVKLENGEKLNAQDLKFLVWECEVHTDEGENERWTRSNTTVAKFGDRLWQVNWEEGLTEMQEHEFYKQVAIEVVKKERVVTETFYEAVKK